MALIGLKVPAETGKLFSNIQVPGAPESRDKYHITIFYLGKDVPMADVAKAMVVTAEVTSATRPFTVRTSRVTCFPKNEDGVPVICAIESPELHAFRERLKAAYEAAGVSFSNRYPDYKPHMTLAYAEEEEVTDRQIAPIEWGAHELFLWASDDGDKGVAVTFPFSRLTIAHRVAARFTASKLLGRDL